jgi:DNA-binding transcriptional MerR regulator
LTLEWTPECILSMEVRGVDGTIRIGRVARQTGISIDTIRFYEKQGLLRRSPRSEGGFRLFDASDIETLKFIRKAQELGFPLNEIRELLILREGRISACSHVKAHLDQKLEAVSWKITELRSLEDSLKRALQRCERELKTARKTGHEECCPVLEQISQAARRFA